MTKRKIDVGELLASMFLACVAMMLIFLIALIIPPAYHALSVWVPTTEEVRTICLAIIGFVVITAVFYWQFERADSK